MSVHTRDLSEVLGTKAGANVLIDLQVVDGKDKENHLVMAKEIQRHPLKEKYLHVDFLKVSRDEKVTTKVPIAITGEEQSVGLKAGGTLQHTLWEVEVECLPADMPDHLFVDISHVDIGDTLKVSDLARPSSVEVLNSADDPILTVLAPRLIVEEEEVAELEEAAEEEAAAEEEMAPEEEKPEEATPRPEGEKG